jgi:Protein of unknown function (DUF3102)
MSALALPDLAQAIEREHLAAHQAARTALEHALECGRLLIEAKAQVGHGRWLAWVEEHLSFGPRQATNYLRLAREVPKLSEGNRQRVSDLSMRDALNQLALNARAIRKLPVAKAAEVMDAAETEALKNPLARVESERRLWRDTASAPDQEKWTIVPAVADGCALSDERLLAAIEHVISDFNLPPLVVLETLNEAYCRVQAGLEMSGVASKAMVLQ